MRNRIISPCEKIDKTSLDVFCIDETKLKESLKDSQIQLKEYQSPHSVKIVCKSTAGGKIVFVKQALIVKIIQNLETTISGTIYIELTIANVAFFDDELLLK